MNTKNNQRFRDTEIRMEASMLDIMKHTEFEKITVKKICEKAQVNRSTFYAHFMDIYDMVDKMEDLLNAELLETYAAAPREEHLIFSEESFLPFLRHIKKHSYFYRINLRHRKSFPIRQGYGPMWNEIIKPQCEKAGITSEEDMMYYFISFQAGFTMILKHWVDTGCRKPEADVAAIIRNCIPAVLHKEKINIKYQL